MAGDWGALPWEAEIGAMGRQEFLKRGRRRRRGGCGELLYGPEQARAFTGLTGIDALACSFGTVHGLYLTTPKLDFDRIRRDTGKHRHSHRDARRIRGQRRRF